MADQITCLFRFTDAVTLHKLSSEGKSAWVSELDLIYIRQNEVQFAPCKCINHNRRIHNNYIVTKGQ